MAAWENMQEDEQEAYLQRQAQIETQIMGEIHPNVARLNQMREQQAELQRERGRQAARRLRDHWRRVADGDGGASEEEEDRGPQQDNEQARGGMDRSPEDRQPEPEQDDLQEEQEEEEADLEEIEDEALARALQASVYHDNESRGDTWTVLCWSSTREYSMQCDLQTKIIDLTATVAVATKMPTHDLVLTLEGRTLPEQCSLAMVDPPYQFRIERRVSLPGRRQHRPSAGQPIRVHVGRVLLDQEHGEVDTGQEEGDLCQAAASSAGGDPYPSSRWEAHERRQMAQEDFRRQLRKREREIRAMTQEDQQVRQVLIKRPRDSLTMQYRHPLRCDEAIEAIARDKKMRRDGYTLYRECEQEEVMQEGTQYYLVWNKQARGGLA